MVDVHADDGGDSSAIFVELLGQMGARCVDTWPRSASDEAGHAEQGDVGITHVVFKDGSKRTLEKVRAAGDLVRCVGANWVLDCERQGQWLDEGPYTIDTGLVPREGGSRRRKSMEPKAVAKLNGGLSSKTTPTRANRRDSSLWMQVPSDGDEHDNDPDWSNMMLTPVPKTPAPDAVARYVAELACDEEDNYDVDDVDDEDYDRDGAPAHEALAPRTCPPKRSQYIDIGEGILSRGKDDNVMLRLTAARRKSLQFAPKVGSPLAQTWK